MNELYEEKHHKLENSHWWFVARRDMIFRLIKGENYNARILDIGCAGGSLIKFLERKGYKNIYGIDISKKAISLCYKKKIKKVILEDARKTRFANNFFDIIIASDILEHIKTDDLALKEWYRILKTQGKLIIFVPAFEFLWSEHDKILLHYRRYSKSGLVNLIKKNHLIVKKISFWNIILFFPIYLLRFSQRFIKNNNQDQLFPTSTMVNKCFINLLKFENLILEKFNFSIGVSIFVIATKQGKL